MKNRHLICGNVVIGFVGIMLSFAAVAIADDWKYFDDRLDNGMRVITMEDHSAPIAAVQIWYHVGSKNDSPERTGFAHLFEHMMFRGTDRLGPEDHFRYLRRYGGNVNGYTTFDHTTYIEEIPSNQLDLTFWLEAERLANLKINDEYFSKEREVVKEEYRLGKDRPYGHLMEAALGLAFKEHPYRWDVIGNLDHLNAATTDEVQAYFKTHYVPNNATLVVVGDVGHDEVLNKAKQYFGWIPKSPTPPAVAARESEITEPRRLDFVEPVGPLPMIAVGYHVCADGQPDSYPLEVLNQILASGESSRIYKHLVKEQEKFMVASGASIFLEQDGLFAVGGIVNMGQDMKEAEQAILGEINDLLDKGVTDEELQKARNQLMSDAVRQRMTDAGKAQRLGHCAVILGNVDLVNQELGLLMKVTKEDVNAVMKKYFQDSRKMTLVVTPALAKANPFKGMFGGKKTDKETPKTNEPKKPADDKSPKE